MMAMAAMAVGWARMRQLMLVALLCCASLPACQPASLPASEQVPITIAAEDQALPPWRFADGSGIDIQLVHQIAPELGLQVTITVLPWKRCLAQLAEGKVDAVLNASYKQDRLAFGCFPLDAAGRPDASRSLHNLTYVLYRRRGEALSWDGRAFSGLTGAIGAQSGFSIVDHLKSLGAVVEDESKDSHVVLPKLAFGRQQGAALLSESAESILAAEAALRVGIEAVEPALESKPYYLMVGKRFTAAHPGLADRIWDAIRKTRGGEAYRKALAEAKR